MITNNTPATIRIIDVLSIALSFHWKKYFMPFPIIVEPERGIRASATSPQARIIVGPFSGSRHIFAMPLNPRRKQN
jgi:hypothetical protein